eukprot:g7339.t1
MYLNELETKERLKNSKDDLETKLRENQSLEKEIERVKQIKTREIESMELEKTNIASSLNETQSKLSKIQATVGILQNEKRRKETEIEEQKVTIESLQTKVDKQIIKLTSIQSNNSNMRHEISSLNDKLFQKDSMIRNLEETIKQNKLSNLEGKKEMQEYFQIEINNINTENRDEIEKLKLNQRDILQKHQFAIAEKDSLSKKLQVDVVSLNKTIEDLQDTIKNIEFRSKNTLSTETKKWETRLEEIERDQLKEIDRMKIDMKDMYDRKLSQMKSQLDFQKKNIAEITALHDEELNRQREELKQQNQNMWKDEI